MIFVRTVSKGGIDKLEKELEAKGFTRAPDGTKAADLKDYQYVRKETRAFLLAYDPDTTITWRDPDSSTASE